MKSVSTPDAPAPAGHYSQAVIHGDVVYVSGQLPIDPDTRAMVGGPIESQVERTLRNVAAILEAAGSGVDRVIKANVYIPDVELWGRVNDAFAAFFGEHRPARVVVPTRELKKGAEVEIDVIAAVG